MLADDYEIVVPLTALQANDSGALFPPGCSVSYNHHTSEDNKHIESSEGVVTSVALGRDPKRPTANGLIYIYDVETAENGTKSTTRFLQENLAYALNCPVHLSTEEGSIEAEVAISQKITPDKGEPRFIYMVIARKGGRVIVEKGVRASRIKYRKESTRHDHESYIPDTKSVHSKGLEQSNNPNPESAQTLIVEECLFTSKGNDTSMAQLSPLTERTSNSICNDDCEKRDRDPIDKSGVDISTLVSKCSTAHENETALKLRLPQTVANLTSEQVNDHKQTEKGSKCTDMTAYDPKSHKNDRKSKTKLLKWEPPPRRVTPPDLPKSSPKGSMDTQVYHSPGHNDNQLHKLEDKTSSSRPSKKPKVGRHSHEITLCVPNWVSSRGDKNALFDHLKMGCDPTVQISLGDSHASEIKVSIEIMLSGSDNFPLRAMNKLADHIMKFVQDEHALLRLLCELQPNSRMSPVKCSHIKAILQLHKFRHLKPSQVPASLWVQLLDLPRCYTGHEKYLLNCHLLQEVRAEGCELHIVSRSFRRIIHNPGCKPYVVVYGAKKAQVAKVTKLVEQSIFDHQEQEVQAI